MNSRLIQGLQDMGIIMEHPIQMETARRIAKLERYIAEIELWNPAYGLTSQGDDILSRHIIDSLSALPFIEQCGPPSRMADIGSGAGLPGIPLAIWLEKTTVTLIEKSGRRSAFLHNAQTLLNLQNVSILESPVEKIRLDHLNHSGFDMIVFRAWAALNPQVIQTLSRLLKQKGIIAAYKGRRSLLEQELASLSGMLKSTQIITLKSWGESAERHLAVLRPN